MTFGLVVKNGPLLPSAPAAHALYAIALLWLIANNDGHGLRNEPKATPRLTGGTR